MVEVPSWRWCHSLRPRPLETQGLGPEPLHAWNGSAAQSPAAVDGAAFSEHSASANVAQFVLPKQVGYVDCGAPFVNHLYGNANSDMGAAAPSDKKHTATVLLSARMAALGGSTLPWRETAPLGALPQPLVLEVELAASTKVGQFTAFGLTAQATKR